MLGGFLLFLASAAACAGAVGAAVAAGFWLASRKPADAEGDAREASALLGSLEGGSGMEFASDAPSLWERSGWRMRAGPSGPALLVHVLARAAGSAPLRSVVDVGCGRGDDCALLAAALPHGTRVTGVDASLALAREASARHGRAGVEFLAADALELEREIPAGTVDLAYLVETASCAAPTPERRRALLASVARCLAPGGRLVLVDFVRSDLADHRGGRGQAAALSVLERVMRMGRLGTQAEWEADAGGAGLVPHAPPADLSGEVTPISDRAWRVASLAVRSPAPLRARWPAYAPHFVAASLTMSHALRGGVARYVVLSWTKPAAGAAASISPPALFR